MEEIRLKLENCYGIKKLEHTFDFSSNGTVAIYAPNGAMKTSFAKTFQDFANNRDSKDLIFPTRPTIREIKKEGGIDLVNTEVFVIESYNQDFSSEKMSTLLVKPALKKRYDEAAQKIEDGKARFLKELKKTSQFKGSIEDEISLTFTSRTGDFFLSLDRLEKEVADGKAPEFADIIYNEIFNEKIQELLKTPDFKETVDEYIKRYEELISKSKYFKKGIFNHNNASAIAKNLMDNGFFQADHSVFLHSTEGDNQIRTKEELEKVIEEEKAAILNDPILAKAFDAIDKKLNANAESRRFRDYLAQNVKVVPELQRLNGFRQKIWVSYFKVHRDLYSSLLSEYHAGAAELEEIAKEAGAEVTTWLEVISIFTKRFSVPFQLKVENQANVILGREIPNIVFEFNDSLGKSTIDKSNLLHVLSTGERRALYILNIIFEVEARRNSGQETLFVVDDVADSFDYKNKYAIIEYLRDISDEPTFRQIILTHNFDFYRTLESRFVPREHCFMVEKSSTDTRLVQASYVRNPFKYWMGNLATNDIQLIASIPFVRNLVEYTKDTKDTDYISLTSLLHFKSDTDSITRADVERIYNSVFPKLNLIVSDPAKKIADLIMELADGCLLATESVNLENKIVLSMAIRLKAEQFMFKKLTNKTEPPYNQTRVLFERYRQEFGTQVAEKENLTILGQVNLMTPENIHLNSFMYEPILDISDEHLKNLYRDVSAFS